MVAVLWRLSKASTQFHIAYGRDLWRAYNVRAAQTGVVAIARSSVPAEIFKSYSIGIRGYSRSASMKSLMQRRRCSSSGSEPAATTVSFWTITAKTLKTGNKIFLVLFLKDDMPWTERNGVAVGKHSKLSISGTFAHCWLARGGSSVQFAGHV